MKASGSKFVRRAAVVSLAVLIQLSSGGLLAAESGVVEDAKQAGSAVGKGIREVGTAGKEIGKRIGHGAAEAGKEIGRAAVKVGKTIGQAAKEGGKALGKAVSGKDGGEKKSADKEGSSD